MSLPNNEKLIRSRARVADHGEVFTPSWLVEDMLDLVKAETERIDSRFLEPACGSGNFLVPILRRKLAAVDLKYGRAEPERSHYSLYALMCIYGIELLEDNVQECRANLLDVFVEHLELNYQGDLHFAAIHVLEANIVHGDAITKECIDGSAIVLAEWSFDGKCRYMRTDFLLKVLITSSTSLIEESAAGEWWEPPYYPPRTISQLAEASRL